MLKWNIPTSCLPRKCRPLIKSTAARMIWFRQFTDFSPFCSTVAIPKRKVRISLEDKKLQVCVHTVGDFKTSKRSFSFHLRQRQDVVDCPTQLTLIFMILYLYLPVVFLDKCHSHKYEKYIRNDSSFKSYLRWMQKPST